MSTNQKEFLEELTALTHKYGIQIGGCGCCGSPAIYKTEPISREDATKIYTVDSEGENLKFEVPQVTVLRPSMFTRTALSSPITVLPYEELVVTTDSTGEVTNVIKRRAEIMNIQEAFNLAIDKGYYTGDVKTSAMCGSLNRMVLDGLITLGLKQSAVDEIETYMAHIVGADDYWDSACSAFMCENLKKAGLPNGKEDLLKLYKDWDNRPNKQES